MLSVSLPLALAVCSALSKHVAGMPRLRAVCVCVGANRKQTYRQTDTVWNETERNGMEWSGLNWTQTVTASRAGQRQRLRQVACGHDVVADADVVPDGVTFAAGNGAERITVMVMVTVTAPNVCMAVAVGALPIFA